MNGQDVVNSIGYCGMACALCEKANYCGGCKSKDPACSLHKSRAGCFQYRCARKKGLDGCWDCDDSPCNEGVFRKGSEHAHRTRAFVRFAKYEGAEELGACLFQNQIHGICCTKDYDETGSESEVATLLTKHYLIKD